MRLSSFNIRSNPPMPMAHVRADLERAAKTRAGIYTWQEVANLFNYRRALLQEFPADDGWQHFFLHRQAAITVDILKFKVVRARAHKLSRGNPLIPQPARYTNELVLEEIGSGMRFAVLDSHWTNGGYNGRRRASWNVRLRKKRWDREYAKTRDLVHDLHREGLNIVGAGDYNREAMVKFHPRQQWIAGSGVVHLWVLPAKGSHFTLNSSRVIHRDELFTDHAGLVGTLNFAPEV